MKARLCSLALAGAIAAIAACARPQPRANETRMQRLNEITGPWGGSDDGD